MHIDSFICVLLLLLIYYYYLPYLLYVCRTVSGVTGASIHSSSCGTHCSTSGSSNVLWGFENCLILILSSGDELFLVFRNDKRFFLKTQSRREVRFLLSNLQAYMDHLEKYPHSLMVRFLGKSSFSNRVEWSCPPLKQIYPAGCCHH